MEGSSVALIGAAGVIVGAILGFFIARLSGDGQSKAELAAAREALDHYRAEVADHFKRSGELIAELTNSYRNVYQHMADGAQQLCSAEVARSVGETMQAEQLEDKSDQDAKAEQSAEEFPAATTAPAASGKPSTEEPTAELAQQTDATGEDPVARSEQVEIPAENTETTTAALESHTESHAIDDATTAQRAPESAENEKTTLAASDFEPQRRAG